MHRHNLYTHEPTNGMQNKLKYPPTHTHPKKTTYLGKETLGDKKKKT